MTYLHYVGVDLGQAADYTALCVLSEPLYCPPAWADALQLAAPADNWLWDLGPLGPHRRAQLRRLNYEEGRPASPPLRVAWLERLPLHTPYPDVVAHVAGLLGRPPLAPDTTALIVDSTGVGRPVVDTMRRAGLAPVPVTITAGYSTVHVPEDRGYRVPKRDLVSVMAVLLEQRRLHVAEALPQAATLRHELETFRRKVTPDGADTYSSWRESDHDDLVLAVALASWYREFFNEHLELANARLARA